MSKYSNNRYPFLPLRDIVVLPHMAVPLFVGRPKSVQALEKAMQEEKPILLVSQKETTTEDPEPEQIYSVGVMADILQLLKLPDGTVKVLVEGNKRVKITKFYDNPTFFEANVALLVQEIGDVEAIPTLMKALIEQFKQYAKVRKNIPEEAVAAVTKEHEPNRLSDTIAGHLNTSIEKKQEILETLSISKRLELVLEFMQNEMSTLKIEKKIKSRVKNQMERSQREYYLNEQMKAIQKELGDGDEGQNEINQLEEKIESLKLSKEAREKAKGELRKLKSMSPMSAEATVVRNYLDWIFSLPWGVKSRVKKDLERAEIVLDKDHYGLEKVKERIIEYLAVQKRSKKLKGPILCLVGPPGVGKTSLGRSVAKATGREFVRISLGGIRDESEIRGHRRTYIGSMPGKIIQSMKKAKTCNPLILLDEIDKMGRDFRGDPASAMLEVLDPEQNSTFVDHYMEIEYDLSDVMFITTANSQNMSSPLLDRMEIIEISGYTEEEKTEIAKNHLIEKQITNHGLNKNEFTISDEALHNIIRVYTREAGVRNLEREIAKLARKSLTSIIKKNQTSVHITPGKLKKFLGVPRFRYGLSQDSDQIGVVTGLAWTSVGGDLLSIESIKLHGKGRMKSTGKLGDVMKESIDAASSFVKSIAPEIGINPHKFEKIDIHVHVPEGATPKDGPSAGIAMVTSIVSVLTNIPVDKTVAMTGEVTLRGHVLAIGGLKEKLLAALRGGIKTVLIPKDNEKDLTEMPDNVRKKLKIIPVSDVREAIKHALTREPEPIFWEENIMDSEDTERLTLEKDQTPITH